MIKNKIKKTPKKTIKVKRKRVDSKKKKIVAKKIVKKVAKKQPKKTTKKKTVRKKRKGRKKVYMEDLYGLINKVQIKKKEVTFVVELIEANTIENTIKDVEVKYEKQEMKTQVVFTLFPDKEDVYADQDILDLELLDDEIPPVDQIFP